MKKQKLSLALITLGVMLLQACNLPKATPTQELDPLAAAELTVTALAQQTPTVALFSTYTPLPRISPLPTFTAAPVSTSTPAFAYVTLSEATNCRVGPAVSFELVDTFLVGQTIEVTGKHPFDNYWYVRSPNNPNVYCWMWGFYANGANLGNVAVLTPPATYTPAATVTASTTAPGTKPSFFPTYVNYGKCINWWTRINLQNVGSVTVKSISISIKDTVTNETRNSTTDGYQDVNACVLSAITPSLASGASITVVSPSLSADPTGHKVTAAITLCTENGMGGACSTSNIEFTP